MGKISTTKSKSGLTFWIEFLVRIPITILLMPLYSLLWLGLKFSGFGAFRNLSTDRWTAIQFKSKSQNSMKANRAEILFYFPALVMSTAGGWFFQFDFDDNKVTRRGFLHFNFWAFVLIRVKSTRQSSETMEFKYSLLAEGNYAKASTL
jgi:hypothetical protein